MPDVDFAGAATRHLRDARYLQEGGRSDSAFYLSGYVVECSLKAVVALPGVDVRQFGHQLTKLEGEGIDLALSMALPAARYRPPTGAVRAVRDAWNPAVRYNSSSIARSQAQTILDYAASVWVASVGEMLLDGLIPELL